MQPDEKPRSRLQRAGAIRPIPEHPAQKIGRTFMTLANKKLEFHLQFPTEHSRADFECINLGGGADHA